MKHSMAPHWLGSEPLLLAGFGEDVLVFVAAPLPPPLPPPPSPELGTPTLCLVDLWRHPHGPAPLLQTCWTS